MSKHGSTGNGDTCPLRPEHGAMLVLTPVRGEPPRQYCPHVMHDGKPGADGYPASRAIWPLYGLEDNLRTYLARLDAKVRGASLPDLSDMEVL